MEYSLLNDWIFKNESPYGISLGDDLNQTLSKIPDVSKLQGSKNNGYHYFDNGFRIGFNDDGIDEIGFDLKYAKNDLVINSDIVINLSKSKIHEVLSFLNDSFISWSVVNSKDFNYLYYTIGEQNISLIFEVYTGKLDTISKSDLP
jgi:hypothetical protein